MGYVQQVVPSDGIMLRGHIITIALVLCDAHLTDINKGHQGISKCQQVSRDAIYWHGIEATFSTILRDATSTSRLRTLCPLSHYSAMRLLKAYVKSRYRLLGVGQELAPSEQLLLQVPIFTWCQIAQGTHCEEIFAKEGTLTEVFTDKQRVHYLHNTVEIFMQNSISLVSQFEQLHKALYPEPNNIIDQSQSSSHSPAKGITWDNTPVT